MRIFTFMLCTSLKTTHTYTDKKKLTTYKYLFFQSKMSESKNLFSFKKQDGLINTSSFTVIVAKCFLAQVTNF